MTKDPDITILKTAKCPTLSGKSTLTYHLGKSSSDELFVKVSANTGGGFFNEEWISLESIREALEKQTEETITAVALYPLFRGKSVNTPAFLLAVLIQEGLVHSGAVPFAQTAYEIAQCHSRKFNIQRLFLVQGLVEMGQPFNLQVDFHCSISSFLD